MGIGTSYFVLDFCIGEDGDSSEKLQWIDEPIVVGVPYHKWWLAGSEDMLEFCEVNTEVITDWFERGKIIP